MAYYFIPHKGALFRVDNNDNDVPSYGLSLRSGAELWFSKTDFQCASRLFSILDLSTTGIVHRTVVHDFVTQRCPVLARRDAEIDTTHSSTSSAQQNSATFNEIWCAVFACSQVQDEDDTDPSYIGMEAWMVLCRLLALAQYLTAQRRFAARHQQNHSSSLIVVDDVPPPSPPVPITADTLLLQYPPTANATTSSMPELDLDHTLLAARDTNNNVQRASSGTVAIEVFGKKKDDQYLEFAVTYTTPANEVVVRRAMADMEWLDAMFRSQKVLGGTLCGRILPPFPLQHAAKESTLEASSSKLQATVTKQIQSATQWMMRGQTATTTTHRDKTSSSTTRGSSGRSSEASSTGPERTAHQLERYVRYLMEHPALSTSFPLNAVLTASQSGLDAAKLCIADCATHNTQLAATAASETTSDDTSSYTQTTIASFAWVRTAAQAAMALRVHGMLETTGLPSASAKLQHAALPNFTAAVRRSEWEDELGGGRMASSVEHGARHAASSSSNNFEDGVVVDDDGFDLLPLPVPAPERRILTVGNGDGATKPMESSSSSSSGHVAEERFHYGMGALDSREKPLENEGGGAYLADIAVDQNIDKLREVIGSVDNTLNRCLQSVARIGKAHKQRLQIHQDVIRGLDSWPEMRGRFVSQRSLMKGVAGIDQSLHAFEESDEAFVDDFSWQARLAGSAVVAAEDVRATVRAARTAANARAAASSAALTAEMACEKNKFAHFDEMRALQTRASIAQSHAIHAAVVEHEAKTVKRRATMALAHDVKTWNIHRKRETLKCCIEFAKAQHEATRRSVDAWSSLCDGFVGTSVNPSIVERRAPLESGPTQPAEEHPNIEPGEVTTTLYDEPMFSTIDNDLFAPPTVNDSLESEETKPAQSSMESSQDTLQDDDFAFPFAEAALVPPTDNLFASNAASSVVSSPGHRTPFGFGSNATTDNLPISRSDTRTRDEKLSASMQSLVDGLMSWGGGFDVDEDLALPAGVAASIAMEGNLGLS